MQSKRERCSGSGERLIFSYNLAVQFELWLLCWRGSRDAKSLSKANAELSSPATRLPITRNGRLIDNKALSTPILLPLYPSYSPPPNLPVLFPRSSPTKTPSQPDPSYSPKSVCPVSIACLLASFSPTSAFLHCSHLSVNVAASVY